MYQVLLNCQDSDEQRRSALKVLQCWLQESDKSKEIQGRIPHSPGDKRFGQGEHKRQHSRILTSSGPCPS